MLRLDFGIDYTHEQDKEFLGTTDAHVFTILKKRYPQIEGPLDKLIERRTKLFLEVFRERAKPLPGVLKFFSYVKEQKWPLGLGTSASRGVMYFVVETLDLKRFFNTQVCADDVKQGKPAPDIYLEVARRLNVNPKYCLVFEDSAYGAQAAKAAGMTCVAIPCGPTLKQDLSHADHILKSMEEVTPEFLKALF